MVTQNLILDKKKEYGLKAKPKKNFKNEKEKLITMRKIKTLKNKMDFAAIRFSNYLKSQKGEGSFTDVVIVILIVAIIGSVLLGLLRIAMPSIFNQVIQNITNGIGGVDFAGTGAGG